MYLVGNVIDKEDERKISTEEGRKAAENNGFNYYMETSAKTGHNIKELFQMASKHIYKVHKHRLDQFVDDEKRDEMITKNSTIYKDSILEPQL